MLIRLKRKDRQTTSKVIRKNAVRDRSVFYSLFKENECAAVRCPPETEKNKKQYSLQLTN